MVIEHDRWGVKGTYFNRYILGMIEELFFFDQKNSYSARSLNEIAKIIMITTKEYTKLDLNSDLSVSRQKLCHRSNSSRQWIYLFKNIL